MWGGGQGIGEGGRKRERDKEEGRESITQHAYT